MWARRPHRDRAHCRCRVAAEYGADEGKSAEPLADLAGRRRHGGLRLAGDLRVFRYARRRRQAVPAGLLGAARRAAPPIARRRHARHSVDVARRGDPAAGAAVDQAHAGMAAENQGVGRCAGGGGRRAWCLAVLHWSRRARRRAGLYRFPFSRAEVARGSPEARRMACGFRGAPVRKSQYAGGRAVIHHHAIGDAKITGVIEYSGPTHAPEFLYPAVSKPERDAVLKANASWLAPNHYVPHMDRLIVTIQLWVLHAGGNVILIDTGVGNRKSRTAAARMDQLNTLVMPWLEAAGAGPEQVTHVVMTHLHTDHVGWNTVEKD